ncbi:MAG TPA: hypothetical protein VKB47_11390 [Terracidiphilus sp.]|nr:hypothetical protein [Terracidiphilus sp.]
MPQYLACNYLPDDFDPSTVTKAMIEEIHALEFNRFRPVAKTVGRVLGCLGSGLASTGSDTFGIPPDNARMTFACPIWIHSRAIELRAETAESGSWRWSVRIPDGQIFGQGTVPSRTSAQEAAQRAFEERLQRASLNRYLPPNGYLWKQLL